LNPILLCTVGGSHEPIVAAIRELAPEHVVFFCSDDDPATARKGSYTQVLGTGMCIKGSAGDERPTLPNIPAQAGLGPEACTVERVPADDLDRAYERMCKAMVEIASTFPDARLVADYTGGTKSMTAALVLAALAHENVELQLVTGSRSDLVKVSSGSERPAPAAVEGLRVSHALSLHVSAWRVFSYGVAAAGLARCKSPVDRELRARLDRARELSHAFDAWDRFDHPSALQTMRRYGAIVGPRLPEHYGALRILAGTESARREGLRIWDLWLNALRRARAGRYDDAVARVYRVIEWTAQWVLHTSAALSTADLPPDVAEPGLTTTSWDGKNQAGLYAGWRLVERHTSGAAARFFAGERQALLHHLEARNLSILAHGFRPIEAASWAPLHGWMEARFVPALREELAAAGQGEVFAQLPDEYPWHET
jgi:CRISPR-associated protein (TIGR02710 family)